MTLLLTNSKFWFAVFALINAIVFFFVPNFPKEIWAAVDILVGVVISIMCGNEIKQARAAARG